MISMMAGALSIMRGAARSERSGSLEMGTCMGSSVSGILRMGMSRMRGGLKMG